MISCPDAIQMEGGFDSINANFQLLTPDHSKYAEFFSVLPVLVVEWPKPGFKVPSKVPDEFKLCSQRWGNLRGISFIPIGTIRLYCLNGLDNALHYEILQSQLQHAIELAQNIAKQNPKFVLQILDPSNPCIIEENNILCRFDLSPNHLSAIPFKKLFSLLSEDGKEDLMRNHTSKDYGLCGWNNATRDKRQCGLARPSTFKGTQCPEVQETLVAFTNIIDSCLPAGQSIYNDNERNSHFANKISTGNRIESLRHAKSIVGREGHTPKPNLLTAHCDTHNEKENHSFKWVCSLSLLLFDPATESVLTHKLITYGKAAAGQYLKRYKAFQVHLNGIQAFWNQLDPGLKYITPNLSPPKSSTNWNILSSPHSMKSVLYSVYAAAIHKLFEHYQFMKLNFWYLVALLVNVITSNCPQHFYNEIAALVDDPLLLKGTHIAEMDPFQFGYLLYLHIFQVKQTCSYPVVPRRQPSSNTEGTTQQIHNSMLALGRTIMATRRIGGEEMERNVKFYYQKVVAILCQSCPIDTLDLTQDTMPFGVLGAGPLTAQEIIGVATLVGAFPQCFGSVAEIGHTTRTFSYLCNELTNSPFSAENYRESTSFWIEALCHLLGINAVQAEEVTCKWVQFLSKTVGKYKDSIPPGIYLMYYDCKSGRLKTIMPDGSIVLTQILEVEYLYGDVLPTAFSDSAAFWLVSPKNWSKCTPKKAVKGSKEYNPNDFLPLLPSPGLSLTQSRASGNLRLPIPSQLCVILGQCNQEKIDPVQILVDSTGQRQSDLFWFKKIKHQIDCNVSSEGLSCNKNGTFDFYLVGIRTRTAEIYFPPFWFQLRFTNDRSIVLNDKRWFPTKTAAKNFACFGLIFDKPHLFNNPLVKDLLLPVSLPSASAKLPTNNIHSYRVFINSQRKKTPVPFFVAVQYTKGGKAFFLVDETGEKASKVITKLPFPKATRNYDRNGHSLKSDLVGFIGIKNHNHDGQNGIKVLVAWEDSLETWEFLNAFVKDAPAEVRRYAEANNLKDQRGWKFFLRCKALRIASYTFVTTEDTLS
jgi:hypothetical protein